MIFALSRVLLLAAVALLVSACGTGEPATRAAEPDVSTSPKPPPGPTPHILLSLPADSLAPLRYELAIDPCKDGSCPVMVRLMRGTEVVDSASLAWGSNTQDTAEEEVDARWGAGDLLVGVPGVKAFASGEEAAYVSTLARSVSIASHQLGVLVTQRAGWEHLKHHHDLFLRDGEKLVRAWSAIDGAGPTWSSVDLVVDPAGTQHILYFSGFLYPSADSPDRLNVSTVEWDEQIKRMVESPPLAALPLEVVEFGRYSKLARAHAGREPLNECVAPLLWVLESRSYGD